MEQSKSDNHLQYNSIQSESNDSLPRSSSVKPVLNYSIRTGEEFALEFMRDRVNPRMPFVQFPAGDPGHTTNYLELKGILGISHTGSESGSEIPMLNTIERTAKDLENSSSRGAIHDYASSSSASDNSSKIKILCSFGGKILPRPSDGKLRYVGGNTRIIRIKRDIFWQELRQKVMEIYIETYAIKYQLPGEDLDALVSVSSDEDLQNMMEECSVLGIGEGSQKLRLFLFSLSDLDDSNSVHSNSGGDSEFQFVVAVNGMDMGGSRKESSMHGLMRSSANNLNELDSQNVDVPSSIPVFPSTGDKSPVETPASVPLQQNIKSPRDDLEGKLPPKPKTNEEKHHEQVHVSSKAVTPNENDSCATNSVVGPDNSGSDLIDLSYLEPPPPVVPPVAPPRVYHSERIPRGPTEFNRLTKSDDSLGSQFLVSQLQSDVDTSESIEDPASQNEENQVQNQNDGGATASGGHGHGQAQVASGVTTTGAPAASGGSRAEHGDILIDINDRFPRDFLSDVFARAMAEDSPGMGVLPQDGTNLSMNIANHEPKNWSFFQKLAGDEFRNKDDHVSLIDQDHLVFLSGLHNIKEEASVVHKDDHAKIEDEEKSTTSLQPSYNPSQMEANEGIQFEDLTENMRVPDSEYEVETRNDALPSIDLSLGDLDISSLQIIRNEDLEELRELGSGTFGTVYHGKWRGTDVAIKRIKKSCFAGRSSEQERLTIEFWREADILSKLHHPNVMAFYGVVQDGPDGTLATVTEFMVDGSLRHVLLRKDRHLDHRKRLIIAMDAAFGMEYLHSKNIVHFDLKCDNLLVNMKDSSRPICKVGDFGLSKIKRNTLVSGGVRGTLPWMAPELLNGGSNKVSEKVDVFSFGIVLWEILTREEPYANMHYGQIIGGIVNNTLRPTIPSDCDPEWRRLMEQCWAPDPVVRPSFTEITNQLRVMSAACQQQSKGHHKAS
ncbi:uncharacterized protein LOC111884952 [Lactuca sativa]|uniref:Protein kinase domain-containing protein n=1 Tax=Lactuca sativa TaxID=4236 RepID=A0A9R1V4M9_LACSA|nr:uncharacterized protein LOC111884952 [Lactuca sativa]KAJ0198288.1 hypothetical protein LSAT_V11C700385660 [Lactuca sativa]